MDDSDNQISGRIKDLGDKATQLLLFLSFALLAAVTLRTAQPNVLTPCQMPVLRWAVRLWVISLFPILACVLPVKEFFLGLGLSLACVRSYKVVLLRTAIAGIVIGTLLFLCAVW